MKIDNYEVTTLGSEAAAAAGAALQMEAAAVIAAVALQAPPFRGHKIKMANVEQWMKTRGFVLDLKPWVRGEGEMMARRAA